MCRLLLGEGRWGCEGGDIRIEGDVLGVRVVGMRLCVGW